LDSLAMLRAIACFDTVTRLHPHGADAWLQLVPLRYERGDLTGAQQAAIQAFTGKPRYAESGLAAAYMAFRDGQTDLADSLFRGAIPGLRSELRRWFDDPTLGGRPPSTGDPWQGLDPDPTTPENELQLEYWSRVAHAVLLFFDPDRPIFDARAA